LKFEIRHILSKSSKTQHRWCKEKDVFISQQFLLTCQEYYKQDQQGKAAFNERNPHTTKQQEPAARSSGGPNKAEHGQANHQNDKQPATEKTNK
jgi:hypothetical protein